MSKKVLPPQAMQHQAEYSREYFQVTVSPDTTVEDIQRPGFWAHHVSKVKTTALIDVISEDGSFDAQLRVVDKGVGFIEMRLLRLWERKTEAGQADNDDLPAIPENYQVNHHSKTGWRFLTINPAQEINRGFKNEREARNAAIEHSRRASGIAA